MKKMYNTTYHQMISMSELPLDFHIHTGPYKIEHTHGYWEIMIVTDNECINVINGEKRIMKKHEVQIIRPDDVHQILSYGEKVHTHINLEIKPKVILESIKSCYTDGFYSELLEKPRIGSFVCNDIDLEYIKKILHRVQLCGNDFHKWEMYLRQVLSYLILLAIDQKNSLLPHSMPEDIDNVTKSAVVVKKALSLMKIKDNFGKTISDFCILLDISEKHLGRLFKEQGRDTPGREFRNIKYDYACGLLLTTSMSVSAIMEEVCIWDLSHFNKVFSERYGKTPGAMRKMKDDLQKNN